MEVTVILNTTENVRGSETLSGVGIANGILKSITRYRAKAPGSDKKRHVYADGGRLEPSKGLVPTTETEQAVSEAKFQLKLGVSII